MGNPNFIPKKTTHKNKLQNVFSLRRSDGFRSQSCSKYVQQNDRYVFQEMYFAIRRRRVGCWRNDVHRQVLFEIHPNATESIDQIESRGCRCSRFDTAITTSTKRRFSSASESLFKKRKKKKKKKTRKKKKQQNFPLKIITA